MQLAPQALSTSLQLPSDVFINSACYDRHMTSDPSAEKMSQTPCCRFFKYQISIYLEFEEELSFFVYSAIFEKLATGTFLGRWLISIIGAFGTLCHFSLTLQYCSRQADL